HVAQQRLREAEDVGSKWASKTRKSAHSRKGGVSTGQDATNAIAAEAGCPLPAEQGARRHAAWRRAPCSAGDAAEAVAATDLADERVRGRRDPPGLSQPGGPHPPPRRTHRSRATCTDR